MILFTRVVARDFGVLFARCMAGRPRGPAPPIVIEVKNGIRCIASTTSDGVALIHSSPAANENDDLLVLPAQVSAELEGSTDEAVTLDRETRLRGVVKWHGGSQPRTLPTELILPGKQHELPALPVFSVVSAKFLVALHECGRTAAKESGRYALSRVQVQGKAGRVIATDGKSALLWKAFRFPFTDDVLVPALSVFAAKPLARSQEVKIGRTATHLVVVAGPWSVWLPVDTQAKYPDVASVIPRQAPTLVTTDPADAAALLPVLAGLPGNDHELRPVTLDADQVVRVRGQFESGDKSGETKEVCLARSRVTGPAIRVALDRRVLARALSLGCQTFKLTPSKPIVAQNDELSLVVTQLDTAFIALPSKPSAPSPVESEVLLSPTRDSERNTAVKTSEPNEHPRSRDEPPDPLTAAEELRVALAEVLMKAGRLITALKAARKEKKALASVWAGLKQLNLKSGDSR